MKYVLNSLMILIVCTNVSMCAKVAKKQCIKSQTQSAKALNNYIAKSSQISTPHKATACKKNAQSTQQKPYHHKDAPSQHNKPKPKPKPPHTTQKMNWLISDIETRKEFLGYSFTDSFDTGMIGKDNENQEYNTFLNKTPAKKSLAAIKDRYEAFVKNIEEFYTPHVRIPKIIHQIWVGPHPFPQDAKAWQQTWLDEHSEWEYKLWTNEDVDALDFENKEYYNQAINWGEKADILRYEILYRFGGVYVDVDEHCLNSFDLLHHMCDFYAGVHALPLMTVHQNALRINNAVIGACPGHPILKAAVINIKKNRKHNELLHRTGPDYFTKMILQEWDSSVESHRDIVFPANYFYPNAQRSGGKFNITPGSTIYVKPETVAIHYYTGYWVKPPKK